MADSYLQMIDGIVYGEDPRQGYVEGNIFYHPELKFKFSFPAGWKYENLPTQVNLGPEDGKALIVFTIAGQKTLQTAADSTLKQLGLTLVNSEKKTVNGMPGYCYCIETDLKGPINRTGADYHGPLLFY